MQFRAPWRIWHLCLLPLHQSPQLSSAFDTVIESSATDGNLERKQRRASMRIAVSSCS